MQVHAPVALFLGILIATSLGCLLYRWGTPRDGPLPDAVPANDLVVLAADPLVASA